ncbi:MAG TPA: VWA domain-containing protein [Pyrinomonadaceae bacterium]|nr:VWA domain-containing protein [Pyrinomonadaceae bacterium]
MKNLALLLLLLGLITVVTKAQTTQSARPRVAPTATPTIKNDPQVTTDRRPPVLNSQSGVKPSATPTTTGTVLKPGEDEVVRIDTNLVTMPVSVLDREGRFISGLQQKDFRIFENGVEQKVEYFQSVEQPFTVILMLDVSPSTQWQIEDIQNAADDFVNQLRPNDRVMVISFDEKVHILSQITNDRYTLHNAIHRTRFGDGTSLYEAVNHVLEQELSQIQGRKAVVLFTDGVDTTSRNASYESTLQASEEADALFYTIRFDTSRDMDPGGYGGYGGGYPSGRRGGGGWGGILGQIITGGQFPGPVYGGGGRRRGAGNTPEEYATGKRYLETLAQDTGGREFEADSLTNLDTAFSGIAEELRRQYSLGYYPEKVGQIGERKQISIHVNRPNVVVRAKNTYIVGQTNRSLAGK